MITGKGKPITETASHRNGLVFRVIPRGAVKGGVKNEARARKGWYYKWIFAKKLGMKKKTSNFTDRETHLVEGLRERPELMERFEAILGLTQCEEGEVRRADEVEDMLVDEVRRLGNTTMREWARKTEEKVAGNFKREHPKSHCAKKKS